MSTEERQLPLFPLNAVLFPNATMPLQIFEERYKLMLEACLKADSQFGVVLIRSGPEVGGDAVPHAVGTVARILQVNRVKEGRSFVSIVGGRRFEIERVVQQRHNRPVAAGVRVHETGGRRPLELHQRTSLPVAYRP